MMFLDDTVRSLPVCQELEANWQKIYNEFVKAQQSVAFLDPKTNKISPLTPVLSPTLKRSRHFENKTKDQYDGEWSTVQAGTDATIDNSQWGDVALGKKIWEWKHKCLFDEYLKNARILFPTLNNIIMQFADKGQCNGAMFSLVEPNTTIPIHKGSEKVVRAHLCLKNDPNCVITLAKDSGERETKNWETGKILSFIDGGEYSHGVRHSGVGSRVVLIFDFELSYLKQKFPNKPWP